MAAAPVYEPFLEQKPGLQARKDEYEPQNRKYDYRPFALRTAVLASLLVITLALIGLLQYAVETFPHEDRVPVMKMVHLNEERAISIGGEYVEHLHAARNASVLPEESEPPPAPSSMPAAKESYVPTAATITSDASIASHTAPSAYVSTIYTINEATSNYVPSEGTATEIPTSPASNYVPSEVTVSEVQRPSAIEASAYVPDGDTYTPTEYSMPSSAYLAPGTTDSAVNPTAAAPSSEYVPDAYKVSTATGASISLLIFTSDPDAYVATAHTFTLPETAFTVTAAAYVASQATAVVSSTHSIAYVPTQGSYTEPTSGAAPVAAYVPHGESRVLPDGSRIIVFPWTPNDVFLSRYLPVILAVVYRILLTIVYNELTLIDPFRQMASLKGGSANGALLSFYHQERALFGPLRALLRGRLTLFFVATACLMSCFLPALASEAIWVNTNWHCPYPMVNEANPCPPLVMVSLVMVRIMQVVLALSALVLIFTILVMWRSRTGLPYDPSTIAAISVMMQHPVLINDLNSMPINTVTDIAALRQALHRKRYKLGIWQGSTGSVRYGIEPAAASDSWLRGILDRRGRYIPVDNISEPLAIPKNRRYRVLDFVLLLTVLGTFGVIMAYYFESSNDGFNRFFSSGTFGPRFILTGAGTVVATLWKSVEQNSMVMAPFIRMAHGPTSPRDSIHFAPTTTPFVSTWISLRSHYWLLALITVVTFLAEMLNVVIGGVPFKTGQTWPEFLASSKISMIVLGLMVVLSIAVIVQRRKEPNIPMPPDTIAAKILYLVGSRMLDSTDAVATIVDKLGSSVSVVPDGRKYRFQPMCRKDGGMSWLVDEVSEFADSL